MRASFDFAGQHVLVTGASRGIGFGVAAAFAAAGAQVTLLAETEEVLTAAARVGGRGLVCDIADPSAVREALDGLGRIDVLVNNAGLERSTPIGDADPETVETFRRIVEVNLIGTWLFTRACLPLLPEGGRLLFTASTWGRVGMAEFSAYVATKHATLGLVRTLARELAPRRIAVNAVCPGWVRTEAALRTLREGAERRGISEDAALAEIVGAQVFDGLMEPAEIARPYLFLASDAAADITGQTLTVDRGELCF